MNKVTTINLNGRAYQLEEAASDKLQEYLHRAERKLANDPDKDEVMQDFEQAIAEKCDQLLTAHKNVISAKEMHAIITSMGPVESADDADEKAESSASTPGTQTKRLYTLKEGSIFGGVCTGLAAYFNVDVTIVRLLFVVLTFFSGGLAILLYVLLMVAVPEAVTPEEKAQLRGEHFSAQGVLNKAKQKYADLSTDKHWKEVAEQTKPAMSRAGEIVLKTTRVISLFLFALAVVSIAALTVCLVTALWWLTFGHVHLQDQLGAIPHWQLTLAVVVAYLIGLLPVVVLAQAFLRYGQARKIGKHTVRWMVLAGCVWVLSWGVATGLAIANRSHVNDYQQTHAYVYFGPNNTHGICINDNLCTPTPADDPHGDPGVGFPSCMRPLLNGARSSTICMEN